MMDLGTDKPMDTCGWICWGLAAVGGLILFILFGAGILAFLLAAASTVGLGIGLRHWFCLSDDDTSVPGLGDKAARSPEALQDAREAPASATPDTTMAEGSPAEVTAKREAIAETAGPAAASVAPIGTVKTPAKKTAKPAKPAAANGKAASAKPASKAKPAAKAPAKAPGKPAAKASAAATSSPAAEPAAQPAAQPAAGSGPEVLSAPRGGQGDDLKRIKGVGPGLEATLNDLGIYHFDQISRWSEADIEWVDSRLRFKGRIQRDDWVSQARALMAES